MKNLKLSVFLFISVTLAACSGAYKCPTYSGTNVQKYKKFKSYSHSNPILKTKKHL